MIDHLEKESLRLSQLDDGPGSGAPILTAAVHHMALVADLLDTASYDSPTGVRLLRVLAQYGKLAGWVAFDLGDTALGQRYRVMSLRAVHAAQDRPYGAYLVGSLSFQQDEIGKHDDASALLDVALRGVKSHGTPRTMGYLALYQALHAARMGDGATSAAAFSRAEGLLHAGAHENDPVNLYWVTEATLLQEQGMCRFWLGDHQAAAELLRRGLALTGNGASGRDRIMYGLTLAEAHHGNGDLEQACTEAANVLPYVPAVGSVRARHLLQRTRDRLAAHRTVPFVRDFLHEADDALAA